MRASQTLTSSMHGELTSFVVSRTPMLGELTAEQAALARHMSDLSEEAYYAGWMHGLEYALWQVVLGDREEYGRLAFSPEHRDTLRRLSASCGGWIVFDDDREQVWVGAAEWERRFSEWLKSPAAKRVDG